MKVHYLDYMNTSQVMHRENDLIEFNEVLMNQLETVDDVGNHDEMSVDLMAAMEREWQGVEEMAETGCNYEVLPIETDCFSVENVQQTDLLHFEPIMEPLCEQTIAETAVNDEVVQPKIKKKIYIKLNGCHRQKCHKESDLRARKTILSLATQSRMPKRSHHKRQHRSVNIDDVVNDTNYRIEQINTEKENRNGNVLTIRTYRVLKNDREPYKLQFIPIYG